MDGGAWWTAVHEAVCVGYDLATKSPPNIKKKKNLDGDRDIPVIL